MKKKESKPVKIMITHQGDIRNIGEHALLKSEMQILKETFENPQITVVSLYSERIKTTEPSVETLSPLIDLQLKNKRILSILLSPLILCLQVLFTCGSISIAKLNFTPPYRAETIKKFMNADLIISSGTQAFREGTVFARGETTSIRATGLFMLFWGVYSVFLAKKVFRKPFITFPQSVGPFRSLIGKSAISYIINNADVFLFRENYSLELLDDIDIETPIYIATDMAFLFTPSPVNSNQRLEKPAIGVSPCFPHSFNKEQRQNYIQTHSKMLDYMIERYNANVCFLPSVIGQGAVEKRDKSPDDCQVSCAIIGAMKYKNRTKLIIANTADEFSALVKQLNILVSTRMHPSILAAIQFVPSLPIVYEHKQALLLKNLDTTGIAIDINRLTLERLKSQTDYLWRNQLERRNFLLKKIPVIKKETRSLVKRVLLMVEKQKNSVSLCYS